MAKRGERTVLFICTGNYYRSRFAEILFNSVAVKMQLPWKASSRGLALERGVNNVGPMAVPAILALKALGIRADDAVARSPAQVTTDELRGARSKMGWSKYKATSVSASPPSWKSWAIR